MLTYADVLRTLRLPPGLVQQLFLLVLGREEPPQPTTLLTSQELLLLWLMQIVTTRLRLADTAVFALLRRYLSLLAQHAAALEAGLRARQGSGAPVSVELYHVGFADGRYATCTGATGFLDVETGETLTQLPQQAIETVAYNLSTLFVYEFARCRKAGLAADVRKHPVAVPAGAHPEGADR